LRSSWTTEEYHSKKAHIGDIPIRIAAFNLDAIHGCSTEDTVIIAITILLQRTDIEIAARASVRKSFA